MGAESQFHIEIVNQHWLGQEEPETDLCSHGEIRLVIAGVVIADATMGLEYGISEGALGLLRTLEDDYVPPSQPSPGRLIPHGCGTMLMFSCPIGIEWTLKHMSGNMAHISDVLRYDTSNNQDPVRFPRVEATVSAQHYLGAVLRFAREAKAFFEASPRVLLDEFDRQQHEEFWTEFDDRLARASARQSG